MRHAPVLGSTMLSASPLMRLPVLTENEVAAGTVLAPPHLCELRERTKKDMTELLLLSCPVQATLRARQT